ncbi:MAG: hypothetical protein WCP58_05670 [bacterium]
MDILHALLAERAFVKRSGQLLSVDAKEIVPGDLLVLKQGQKVPADARLQESHDMKADESTLTGENMGVQKKV